MSVCENFEPSAPGTIWGGSACKNCPKKFREHKKKVAAPAPKKTRRRRFGSTARNKKEEKKEEEKKTDVLEIPKNPALTRKSMARQTVAMLFDFHKQNERHHGEEDGDYSIWLIDKILRLQRHFRRRQAQNPHLIQQHYAAFCEATDMMPIMNEFKQLYEHAVPPAVKPGDRSYMYLRDRVGINFKTKKLWRILGDLQKNTFFNERPGLNRKAVVVGAGPAGLRMAIDLRLMGFDVTILEKRDNFARYNVLHIWDLTATDFLTLGVKFFDPLFGAGSLQTVPIRVVQQLLLKVCLCLGCEVYANATFNSISPPTPDSEVEEERKSYSVTATIKEGKTTSTKVFPCEILMGADGAGSKVAQPAGFERKMSSGSLALGFTCNFENHQTRVERNLTQMKKAYQFEQKFFDEIDQKTGCFLENLVYFRCPTNHYFVLCPRKSGLLKTGVFRHNHTGPSLTRSDNVDRDALMRLGRGIATVCGIPETNDFCRRANGSEDVALFDFSRRVMSEQAITYHVWTPASQEAKADTPQAEIYGEGERVTLVCGLVGDSLLEPFWPQGTGLNKAVLACMDTVWFLKKYYELDADAPWDQHLANLGPLFAERAQNLQYMHTASPHALQQVDKKVVNKLGMAQHGYFCDPQHRYKKSTPVLSRPTSSRRRAASSARPTTSRPRTKSSSCSVAPSIQQVFLPEEIVEDAMDMSALVPHHFLGVPDEGHFWFRPAHMNITHPLP